MAFVLPGESGRNFGMAPGSTGGLTPTAPVIISSLTASGTVGTAFSYFIIATGNPTSYAATGLPAGLTLNTVTGQITGTPTTAVAGTNVMISATNALGTDSQTLVLTIAAARPVVSGGTLSGTAGTAITPFQISATNSPTSYAVTPALPAGLSLNTTTGQITGTPAAGGNTSVQVTATNAGGTSAPATLNINIAAVLGAPVVTAGTLSGQVGVPITPYQIQATNSPTSYGAITLSAGLSVSATGLITGTPTVSTVPVVTAASTTGEVGTPFSYQMQATNVVTSWSMSPPVSGLSISSTGLISGTPDTAMTTNVTISATNAAGTGTANLALTITPAAGAGVPVITSPLTYRVAPSGTVSYQIAASNGPITAYAATGLPAGVTVNTTSGLISGTAPAALGDTNVTLTATNATGTSAPATLVFTVSAGWEISNETGTAVVIQQTGPTGTEAAFGPMPNWTDWQPAFAADVTDALYDAPTPAAQTVRLFALFSPYTAGTEVEVPFDNFANPPGGNNLVREWGYNSVTNSVYLNGGSNITGNPIRVRLVKA